MKGMENFMTVGLFIPHGHCYLWKPELIWLHVTADSLIAIAYFVISAALAYFIQKRQHISFKGVAVLFSAFILLCGTTHIMEVWTLWHPDYWFAGLIKSLTGIISVFTALTLLPLIPKALTMPTHAQLESINNALAKEISERKQVELELSHNLDLREAIYEEATDALFLVHPETLCILDCNRQAVEMFEVNNKKDLINFQEDSLQKAKFSPVELNEINKAIQQEKFWKGDVEFIGYKGKHFWGNLAIKQIKVANQVMNLVHIKDIDDRKLAEQEALEGKRTLDALMEYIPEGITIADASDVTIRRVSKYGEVLTGRSRYSLEHIAVHQHVQAWGILCADGMTLPKNEELPLTRAVQKGEIITDEEWIIQQPSGKKLVISCNAGPILGEDNKIIGAVIAWRDITDRKRIEKYICNLNIELEARVSQRTQELSRINAELATEVREHKKTEERFNLVLSNSPITVFMQDQDLRYTWIYNPALGVSQESILGKTDQEIFTVEDAQKLSLLKQRVLNTNVGLREEVQVFTDGAEKYFDLIVEPLKNSHGEISGIGCVALDITWRKESEAELKSAYERELSLTKEVHHRVKNNLQIISGLLYLQSRHVEDVSTQAVIQSCRDRILSMALLHEKLYQSRDLKNIDFVSYIRSLTLKLKSSYASFSKEISLNINSEPVTVNIDTAIYCGLIVNELVSNALKHAFPEDYLGQINIEFYQNDLGEYTLAVHDNGIGMSESIDLKNIKSLGLQLVYSLAIQQLKGRISLENDNGTRFKISFCVST